MLNNIANSLGFGSGIDTAALVRDLAEASRAPKVQRFEALSRATQAKVSALSQAPIRSRSSHQVARCGANPSPRTTPRSQ